MRAFLEKIDNEWLDDFVYASKQPLLDLGVNVIGFDGTFLEENFLNKYNLNDTDIVIGSVEAVSKFFERVYNKCPEYLGYPDDLKPHLHREIIKTTLKQLGCSRGGVKRLGEGCNFNTNCTYPDCLTGMKFPFFIKPASKVKQFTGSIVENHTQLDLLRTYDNLTGDQEVYVSELIDVDSEYRCFVHKGEIKGIEFYSGDFKKFPDPYVIDAMVKQFKHAPVAYSLDVGILSGYRDKTVLIEINDFWALGSYGFSGKEYVRMTIDRFSEIKKQLR